MRLRLSRADAPEAAKARETVRKLVGKGKRELTLHFEAGNDAWTEGDDETARVPGELAYNEAPEISALATNVAVILAFGCKPDPPHALEIINAAMGRMDDPPLRETRGRFTDRMGEW